MMGKKYICNKKWRKERKIQKKIEEKMINKMKCQMSDAWTMRIPVAACSLSHENQRNKTENELRHNRDVCALSSNWPMKFSRKMRSPKIQEANYVVHTLTQIQIDTETSAPSIHNDTQTISSKEIRYVSTDFRASVICSLSFVCVLWLISQACSMFFVVYMLIIREKTARNLKPGVFRAVFRCS